MKFITVPQTLYIYGLHNFTMNIIVLGLLVYLPIQDCHGREIHSLQMVVTKVSLVSCTVTVQL
jgi:hypothetical protein